MWSSSKIKDFDGVHEGECGEVPINVVLYSVTWSTTSNESTASAGLHRTINVTVFAGTTSAADCHDPVDAVTGSAETAASLEKNSRAS
ncbi:unnamed protein product [Nippostrongylus brasiliensis]|uniref:Uncharacterized protein n=1 Tax=Nippostrongylus brasiliensis TaxID=27835 RepID=A0A0N4YRJ8_NIPBR|nr:unnamed protein product [Nippostrongylus brasiliensis]